MDFMKLYTAYSAQCENGEIFDVAMVMEELSENGISENIYFSKDARTVHFTGELDDKSRCCVTY